MRGKDVIQINLTRFLSWNQLSTKNLKGMKGLSVYDIIHPLLLGNSNSKLKTMEVILMQKVLFSFFCIFCFVIGSSFTVHAFSPKQLPISQTSDRWKMDKKTVRRKESINRHLYLNKIKLCEKTPLFLMEFFYYNIYILKTLHNHNVVGVLKYLFSVLSFKEERGTFTSLPSFIFRSTTVFVLSSSSPIIST